MNNKKLEITYQPIADIYAHLSNARTHNQDQIERLKKSITEFGMNTAIGLYGKTIVYGHGRVEALKQLGETLVPTVDLSHLSESQKKAYVIADNRIALDAGWDNELLKLELSVLDELDFDLSLTGFSKDELCDYLDKVNFDLTDENSYTNTEKPFKFKGVLNDDVNTYTSLGNVGSLFITVPRIRLEQKQTQANEGGLTDIYLEKGTYIKSLYSVMYCPSFVTVNNMGVFNMRLHHRVQWKYAVPKIISEGLRKVDNHVR